MKFLLDKYQKLDVPFIDLDSEITIHDVDNALNLFNNVIGNGYASPDIRLRYFAGSTWLRFPNQIIYGSNDDQWNGLARLFGKPFDDKEKTFLIDTANQLEPTINKMVDALSKKLGGKYIAHGIEINTLTPGQKILPHKDNHYLDDQTHRVHLVLETNSEAFITCQGETKHFAKGSVFILNNKMEHDVINQGSTPRTHLVVDCLEYE